MNRKQEHSFQSAGPGRVIGPETVRPSAQEIEALAYELWRARGCPDGSPDFDWMRAEERLKTANGTRDLMAA